MRPSNHPGHVLPQDTAPEDGNEEVTTGQPVSLRVAFKPTSSIPTPRKTVNEAGEELELRTKGRHDPCVGIRAAPVGEAMMACVLADHLLRHRAQCG